MDLHLELVQDLQTLRRKNAELDWWIRSTQRTMAADQILYGVRPEVIGPRSLTGQGIASLEAAIRETTAVERALKTMRVFHFQYTIPRERCPKCGHEPLEAPAGASAQPSPPSAESTPTESQSTLAAAAAGEAVRALVGSES